VIFIQGIDSRGDCSGTDGTLARRHLMVRTIQTLWPSVNQTASQIDDGDVIGFSYSGRYMDCDTGQQYTRYDFPSATLTPDIQRNSLLPLIPAPVYSPGDTCNGVKDASQHLEALINQILRLEPDARFVLIGHSLGGMIAAYYVSQQPEAFVEEKIQKVVTVDSPLLGYPNHKPGSACSKAGPTWQDIFGNSDVVPAIGRIQNQPMVERFYAINSTEIGDTLLDHGRNLTTLNCASVRTVGGITGGGFLLGLIGLLIGGPSGAAIIGSGTLVVGAGAYSQGHSCAFADETTLHQISTLVNDSMR
jgi:pimeloyl-ACP methyl ester carboxylesterase